MKYEKINLKTPVLGLYPVYIEDVYDGHEPFRVVGIREESVELRGDWSGGTHPIDDADWIGLERCFLVREVCKENSAIGGCKRPNVHCCGGGAVVKKHVQWWKDEEEKDVEREITITMPESKAILVRSCLIRTSARGEMLKAGEEVEREIERQINKK